MSILQINFNQILNKVGALGNDKKVKNELIGKLKEQNVNLRVVIQHLNNIDEKTQKYDLRLHMCIAYTKFWLIMWHS